MSSLHPTKARWGCAPPYFALLQLEQLARQQAGSRRSRGLLHGARRNRLSGRFDARRLTAARFAATAVRTAVAAVFAAAAADGLHDPLGHALLFHDRCLHQHGLGANLAAGRLQNLFAMAATVAVGLAAGAHAFASARHAEVFAFARILERRFLDDLLHGAADLADLAAAAVVTAMPDAARLRRRSADGENGQGQQRATKHVRSFRGNEVLQYPFYRTAGTPSCGGSRDVPQSRRNRLDTPGG